MKALIPERIYRYYKTLCGYFHLFPIKKKMDGEYVCDLLYVDSDGKENGFAWSIPKEYIEDENGSVSYSQKDVYFGRWTIREDYYRENKDDGTYEIKKVYKPVRLVGFWNTSLFKYKMDMFK